MEHDLGGIAVFVAVAEKEGFRAAGRHLGVSGSAVSQAISQLEERLGIALFNRTTRSVRLTEAGERLYRSVRPALAEMQTALHGVRDLGEEPRGTLRLNVSGAANHFLSGPVLGGFLRLYPDVSLELVVSDDPADIVAEGYDAAVRLGEVIDQDMITVPVSGAMRLVVVGAPSYFAKHPKPEHPRDLVGHTCLNWRPRPEVAPYRWEFSEDGHDFAVAVEARVLTNHPAINIRLAVEGIGLALGREDRVGPHVERGELEFVLEEYCTPYPGFYLYYPQRRQASPPLRALIDYLLEIRRNDRG
jgi:DNA-binding transcriptional LysR family regulator